MISSRKQEKVNEAVLQLEKEEIGCSVKGVVCHVAKAEDRKNLIEQVRTLKSKRKNAWFNMATPLESLINNWQEKLSGLLQENSLRLIGQISISFADCHFS